MTAPSEDFYPLQGDEKQVPVSGELYLRQCSPAFIEHDGIPSIKMFENSSKDEGKLSGARSDKVSAQDAFEERRDQGGLTAGTWGVTISEVENFGSRVVDDSAELEDPPTGHSYVDYRHLSSKPSRRAVRSRLHEAAVVRGIQWPLPDDDGTELGNGYHPGQ